MHRRQLSSYDVGSSLQGTAWAAYCMLLASTHPKLLPYHDIPVLSCQLAAAVLVMLQGPWRCGWWPWWAGVHQDQRG
jgi:hypothetical protein